MYQEGFIDMSVFGIIQNNYGLWGYWPNIKWFRGIYGWRLELYQPWFLSQNCTKWRTIL